MRLAGAVIKFPPVLFGWRKVLPPRIYIVGYYIEYTEIIVFYIFNRRAVTAAPVIIIYVKLLMGDRLKYNPSSLIPIIRIGCWIVLTKWNF